MVGWEIDQITGNFVYGTTTVDPTGYGRTLPPSPERGQMFFDYNNNKLKEWNGSKWIEKIRVFAAKWDGNTINEFGEYSQVNLKGRREAGVIIYDGNDRPVFAYSKDVDRTKYFSQNKSRLDNVFSNSQKVVFDHFSGPPPGCTFEPIQLLPK